MKKYVLGPNAARQLKKLLRGSGEVSRRDNLAPGLAFGSEYANPYAVQWAQSANDGEGGWIIWLPGDALLVVDGVTIDVREDLEAVGGDYPDGWYLLGDVIEDDGTLYLDITFPDPDDEAAAEEPTAAFSNGETEDDEGDEDSGGDEDDGSKVIHVAICDVATDSSTGARTVHQFVTSAIVWSSGGDIDVDNVSVDKDGGESGGKLEIAHFKDGEKDSGTGLDSLLRADPETGEISAEGADGIMLVARKDGEVVYIPIGGGGGEDPDTPGGKGGCDDHPGGGDAVDPNAGGGGGGGVHVIDDGGAVPIGGGFPDGGRASCCD